MGGVIDVIDVCFALTCGNVLAVIDRDIGRD
jgi:hypothetical protein